MSTQEASFASAAVKAFKLNLDRSTKFFSALTPEQFETRVEQLLTSPGAALGRGSAAVAALAWCTGRNRAFSLSGYAA